MRVVYTFCFVCLQSREQKLLCVLAQGKGALAELHNQLKTIHLPCAQNILGAFRRSPLSFSSL
jgi:hypothetical protein